jgi:colicin import membrane protein
MNELEAAAQVASGELPSPTRFGKSVLAALRVSGTGLATRTSIGETVWRDPAVWLSDDTIARCSGLPIVMDHPPSGALDTGEYADSAVGSVMHAYPADRAGFPNPDGPDLWCCARLFMDDSDIAEIADSSTSPCVVFGPNDGNQTITLPDGTECLVEASPSLLDHLAIVTKTAGSAGVWDKNDDGARGIRFDNQNGVNSMPTEEEQMQAGKARKDAEEQARKDAEGGNIDKLLKGVDLW